MNVRPFGASVPLCLLALLSSGCAYYNGMYNTRRWARQAERSERSGRISEARERWQRSALHAESLLARHPRSRWADDALLARGRALEHMEFHTEAATVLERAAEVAGSREQRLEALLLLGRARLALRRYGEARVALDSAVGSEQRARRAESLLYRGRALFALGDASAALEDFRASSHPAARFERARTATQLRDTAQAFLLFDSLVRDERYVERDWLAALDSLAHAGALARAAQLVDTLLQRQDLGRGVRARLLLADGDRALSSGDTARASSRFRAIARIAPDSAESRTASVRLERLALRGVTTDIQLAEIRERLDDVAREGGQPAREAQQTLRLIARLDTLAAAPTGADAFWFLRAELLRDSLAAGPMAAVAFGEMAERFPDSPWTPKGLLAAIGAGSEQADSLRALLAGRYRESPYAAAYLGETQAGYEALEDSLRRVLLVRPAAQRGRQAAPGAQGAAEDDEAIDRRRRPPQAPVRPAQPQPPRPTTPVRPPDPRE